MTDVLSKLDSRIASNVSAARCRLCGEESAVAVGYPATAFASNVGGKTFHHPPFQALKCTRCGTYYKSASPDPADLEEYYQTINFGCWEIDGFFPTERCVLRELTAITPGSRLLDFGCGSGRLLATQTGRHQCFGYEINPMSAAVAAQRGVTILSENELFDANLDPFDAILLIDVYEHLIDPLGLLQRLVARLRTSGRLFLVTGNADARAAQKDLANFWYFRTYGHLLMLSGDSSRYLSDVLGLRLRSWIEMSHYDRPPLEQMLKQWIQEWAFDSFHYGHKSTLRRILRWVPLVRNAEHWRERVSRTYTADHVVAVYEKSHIA